MSVTEDLPAATRTRSEGPASEKFTVTIKAPVRDQKYAGMLVDAQVKLVMDELFNNRPDLLKELVTRRPEYAKGGEKTLTSRISIFHTGPRNGEDFHYTHAELICEPFEYKEALVCAMKGIDGERERQRMKMCAVLPLIILGVLPSKDK